MMPSFLIRSFLLLPFTLLLATGMKGQDSSNISLLDHWEDTTLASSSFYNNTYNEVWGFVEDSTEYAVIGSTKGTHIFDLSDPSNIQLADLVPGAHQGSDIVHRDYHTHQGHLYMVSDEGQSTLQIADLSPLPDSVELVYDSDQVIKNAHNIFIDTSSDRLYGCGVTTNSNTLENLRVLDISTPDTAVHVRDYNNTHYFHDIYVRNDTAYGHHGNDAGLIVYDVSDPNNIQVLGSLPNYTDQGYNHSGWLSRSGDHYVMADEDHGMRMKMLDVSDLSNIQEESLFLSGVDNNSMAHNPIIMGDHVYVGHYHDGVYIWDISDPKNPDKTGFYDTYPPSDHNSFRGAWGVYPFLPSGILLASDMQSGLFVLDVSQATTSVERREQENAPSFEVYPSPARNALWIKTKGSIKAPLSIHISDLSGRTLIERELQAPTKGKIRIGLDALKSSGLHILRIRTPEGIYTKKFVKRR